VPLLPCLASPVLPKPPTHRGQDRRRTDHRFAGVRARRRWGRPLRGEENAPARDGFVQHRGRSVPHPAGYSACHWVSCCCSTSSGSVI